MPNIRLEKETTIATYSVYFGGKSNRFHATARIEVAPAEVPRLETAIREILEAASARDLRWKDLDGAKERFAAQKLFEFAAREMGEGTLRIEVEVWDLRAAQGRAAHDGGNHARWFDVAASRSAHTREAPEGRAGESPRGAAEKRGDPSALVQLAGLFAGLVSFSYEKRDEYEAWLRRSSPQCALYSNEVAEFLPSKVSTERFQVLRHFLDTCAAEGLPVSLATARGLGTPGGSLPVARAPLRISFKVD